MPLFGITGPDCDAGYLNIQAAQYPVEAAIKDGLETLWKRYEPYADTNFRIEFARQPEARFWEMYLTTQLLKARKRISQRSKLPAADRNSGPDICIPKRRRKIWVEAIAPDPGDAANLDAVPDLFFARADQVRDAPRRQIELRITSALLKKVDAFRVYREEGIVGENDSCIVAISAGQFALQTAGSGLPHAVTSVYPFGSEFFAIDNSTRRIARRGYHYSAQILRVAGNPIPRSAFQHDYFAGVSGLIWSSRSIGNFLGQSDDFVFVHNQVAQRPIERNWIDWLEEYMPDKDGKQLTIMRHREES